MSAWLRIELFPADLDTAITFYRDILRFEVVRDERSSQTPYAALRRGSVELGLAHRDEPVNLDARRPPTGTEVVLEVADVHLEHDRVRAIWPVEEGLTLRDWGLSDFRILDPAGYYLRITHR